MAAAPSTPASVPARDGMMRRCSVASGRERGVDDLADAGQQVLTGESELTADDDHRGVDEVDHRRDDVAQVTAGPPPTAAFDAAFSQER